MIRAKETDGSEWVEADVFDEVLTALKLILPLAKGYAPEGQSKQARHTCDDWIAAAVAAVERAESTT